MRGSVSRNTEEGGEDGNRNPLSWFTLLLQSAALGQKLTGFGLKQGSTLPLVCISTLWIKRIIFGTARFFGRTTYEVLQFYSYLLNCPEFDFYRQFRALQFRDYGKWNFFFGKDHPNGLGPAITRWLTPYPNHTTTTPLTAKSSVSQHYVTRNCKKYLRLLNK